MTNDEMRCGNCAFWVGPLAAQCRRFPPTIVSADTRTLILAPTNGSGVARGYFPQALEHESCGEFKLKEQSSSKKTGDDSGT